MMQKEEKIIVVELNHKRTPVEIREVISTNAKHIWRKLENLRDIIPEVFIISTCNRFSIYSYCKSEKPILNVISSFSDKITSKNVTIHYDEDAVTHLFSTTAGLESQIVGEHEILGQVRKSFTSFKEKKNRGPILNELVNKSIHVGKRVRAETYFGKYPVSLAAIANKIINRKFSDLSAVSVMVCGTGEMAQIVLKMLAKHQLSKTYIVSRNIARASSLAKKYNAQSLSPKEAMHVSPSTTILIGVTDADQYILTKADVVKWKNPSIQMIIDLGMPRNFDPEIVSNNNIELYDLDAFKQESSKAIENRIKEIAEVRSIIQEEITKFQQWFRFRKYVPIIKKLKNHLLDLKKESIKKALDKAPDLNKHHWAALEVEINGDIKKTLTETINFYRELNDLKFSRNRARTFSNRSSSLLNVKLAGKDRSKLQTKITSVAI